MAPSVQLSRSLKKSLEKTLKKSQSWLSMLMLFTLVGCGGQAVDEQNPQPQTGQAAQTTNPPEQGTSGQGTLDQVNNAQPTFNLSEVKRQYQNTALTVVDVSERNKDGKNAIMVSLSVPLNPSVNHQSFFAITRIDDANNGQSVKGQFVKGQWVLSDSGKQMWFDNIEPSSSYKIIVEAGLTAANDNQLATIQSNTIKTRRLRATATFDTDGHYIISGIKQGLPVQAVNVGGINIDYFRIKPSNIEYFLSQINYVYRWNIKRITSLGELAYSGRYDLSAPKNTRVKRQIDVSGIDELQASGIYFAVMTGLGEYDNLEHTWFSITDLGLHTRVYQGRIEAHVKSITTGEVLNNIDVSAYYYDESSHEQRITKTVKTNAQGIAIFDGLNSKISSIVASTNSQMSMVRMGQPQLDLSEFNIGERPQLPAELFIYAPRDLYRPGESIDFNALIRNGDGQFDNAPVLSAKVRTPDGAVAHEFNWQARELGYYHYNWSISPSAAVGNWSLEVTGPFNQAQVYSFKVEEFMPERLKLTFNDGDKTPLTFSYGKKVSVPVLGEYLYGAPASNNRLSTDVVVRPWRNPVKTLAKFQFGDISDSNTRTSEQLTDINLDLSGRANLQVQASWSKTTPIKAQFVSSLFESGGRPVVRNYSALVWPQDKLLGIAPRYKVVAEHGGPKENSMVKFAVVKADIDGKRYAAKNIKVSLIRLDRNYFWVNDNSRGWHYRWTDNEYVAMTKMIDIADGQETMVDFPVEYGGYLVKAEDSDGKLITSVRFHAGFDWYRAWEDSKDASQSAQPDKITLALDKGAYGAGDIATVNIVAPHSGQAMVMVEGSEGPLWQQAVDVSDKGTQVQIPVDSSWQAHNLYVTAMVVRPAGSKQAITPKRSFGLIHLPIDRKSRHLDVSIELTDKLLPQQTVTAKVKVGDFAGSAQADTAQNIKVTLAVVDVGVLNISDFETPSPSQYFFGQRRYEVQSRDMFDQLIDVEQRDGAKLRFGGDADLARGGNKPHTDVRIVSMFYQPKNVVNGVAEFDIELPDFNGQLRLMAVAFSEDKVGSSEHHVTVAAPVVAELSMPRFLAYQDKATIAVDLHNLSDASQNMDVQLSVVGQAKLLVNQKDAHKTSLFKVSPAQLNLSLAPNERKILRYQIEATGINGTAQITATAKGIRLDGQSSNLMRQWQLGLRPAYPLTVRQTNATVKKGESWQFDKQLIKGLIPHTVNISMSADNSVKLPLGDQLNNLLGYPYGCLEQTSSRAFVLTYASEQAQKSMAVNPMSDGERIKAITKGIDRLASLQLSNGGYGLWSSNSPEEHWLTVYVADFLVSAKEMGINVPDEQFYNTTSRLREYLRKKQGFSNERYSSDRENYRFSYRAYAGYVLSRLNRASLGQLRQIYDNQWDDSQTLIGKFHLGLALYNMGDKKRGIKALNRAIEQVNKYERGDNYYGDYGSDLRDWALITHLMLESKLADEFALSLGEFVAEQVYRKQWLSTQERNALFLAGTSLANHQGKSWSAELMLAKSKQTINRQGSLRRLVGVDEVSQGLSLTSTSETPLFVDAAVSGYTASKPQPVSEKLNIERRWYNLQGEQINPSSFKSGELAIVKLTVNAKQRTPDALIVDLVPAGFEPENQNLGKGIALKDLKIDNISLDNYIYSDRVKYQEYRDDRFVAAVDLVKDRDLSVVYLIRAVTPGDYLVPPPFVEDMYAPKHRAIGQSIERIKVLAP